MFIIPLVIVVTEVVSPPISVNLSILPLNPKILYEKFVSMIENVIGLIPLKLRRILLFEVTDAVIITGRNNLCNHNNQWYNKHIS